MTLERLIKERITSAGPMTVADYMAECLMHPEHGYYSTRDPLGASGDFTTAPEISQMFGEMIGLCLAQAWMDQGAASQITLAELGPGRGTLMADALRATRKVPGFHDALSVHFVEASPTLRKAQKTAVPSASFHETADSLPGGPLFLIANEFFDALPIRQFQRAEDGWHERMIGLDNDLSFGLSHPAPLKALEHRLTDTKPGDVVETCAAATGIVEQISKRIEADGGAALIVDYGDWISLGDTLQALREHQPVSPLENPGTADLTAHVDFEALASAANCAHTRLTPQGVFLERLGITARAQALAKQLDGHALTSHIAAHRRLTHPEEMGNLFKVLGLHSTGTPPPPGLMP